MTESSDRMRQVAFRARNLLARTQDRASRDVLIAIISIFDATADDLKGLNEQDQTICVDPGPAGFDFSEDPPPHLRIIN